MDSVKGVPSAGAPSTVDYMPREVKKLTQRDAVLIFLCKYADWVWDRMLNARHTISPQRQQKLVLEESQARLQEFKNWFLIVNGAHRCQALVRLAKVNPSYWLWYKCWIDIADCSDFDLLQLFARYRNEKQTEEHYTFVTIRDMLREIQRIMPVMIVELGGDGKKLSQESVARS